MVVDTLTVTVNVGHDKPRTAIHLNAAQSCTTEVIITSKASSLKFVA